jgi:hypothetical protein
LRGDRCNLAQSPEQGRKLALQTVNMRLAKWHHCTRLPLAVPSNNPISMITIDNKNYKLNALSDDAKAQLQSLQFCDAELQRLSAQTAVLQTARMAYANALSLALPALIDDTMKLN